MMMAIDNYAYWLSWLAVMCITQAAVLHPRIIRHLRHIAPGTLSRAVVALVVGQITFIGGSKPPSVKNLVAQFITVLRSGVVIDASGVVAKATEEAVLESFIGYASDINAAASGTVANAAGEFREVAALVTNTERRVIYISSYLPRSGTGQGGIVNHNIASTCEQTRMDAGGTNLIAWVWFSAEPAFAPGMVAEIDVGGGPFTVPCVTNFYPATESVNGADCVKYVFAIPEGSRGVQLIPSYEVRFGTLAKPLAVPSGGIVVVTNNVPVLPFSGTDRYFGGRLAVEHHGGIATKAFINGTPLTNGVHHL